MEFVSSFAGELLGVCRERVAFQKLSEYMYMYFDVVIVSSENNVAWFIFNTMCSVILGLLHFGRILQVQVPVRMPDEYEEDFCFSLM